MLGAVFERFVAKSPIAVMVRAALERVLGADRLEQWDERTAQNQYTREWRFSTVYDLMSQVVFRVQPAVRAAYRAQAADVGASVVSVYTNLNGLATHTSAELVRSSARKFGPLIAHWAGERPPWLAGYRVKSIDGNGLEATEPRRKVLRGVAAGALPGKALVVYAPALGWVTDVFPCEDGHAQERALCGDVLKTVEAGALWIDERHLCTREVLCQIDSRAAFLLTRDHQGLPCESFSPLQAGGRTPPGEVAQPRVRVMDAEGNWHAFRRLRITRKQATRDGAKLLYMLTNLPRHVSAKRGADRYRKRWTLETAFQPLEASFHAAMHPWGYPKAALCGLCLSLVAANVLAVVLAALRGVPGEDIVDHEVSVYDIANAIATTYHGRMIAIPAPAWDLFYAMSLTELAAIFQALAQRVNLRAFRKSPRGPKKPRPERSGPPMSGHVSTAQLLMSCTASLAPPVQG